MKRLSSVTCALLLVLAVLLLPSLCVEKAEAADFIVNSLSDTDDASCNISHCSLREAINAANLGAGADTISFSVSGTITLGATLPQVTDTAGLTISAQPGQVTVSGNDAVQILSVATGAPLTLQGLALVHGYHQDGSGGAIYAAGPLTVDECTFSNNRAVRGGAIGSSSSPKTVTRSTFYQNSTTETGGAINHGYNTFTIRNCTFTGNAAPTGAVLFNGSGWGMEVHYSTIAGNSASAGAIIHNQSGGITFYSTIVANAAAAANCQGNIYNGGHNLDSAASCGWGSDDGSMSNTDPLLRPFANYGGATNTFALQPASPAIDAAGTAGCPATDQRGVPRPFGSSCDIGAFEFSGSGLPFLPLLLNE